MTATWDWLAKLTELRDARRAAALVTVTRCKGSSPCAPGAKMLVLADQSLFGTVGGGRLEQLAIADAIASLADGVPKALSYTLGASAGQCCGGVVEVFVEPYGVGPELYLFGAGHVGQALCRVLAGTPFVVHAVDERAEWIRALPEGVIAHDGGWDLFAREATWSATRTFVAIMTHRHDLDEAIVAEVVKRPARYLGLIGSDTKWARFRARLAGRGVASELLDRVKCPIGVGSYGKSPPEVAISIAADLLRAHYGEERDSSLQDSPPSG